MPDTKILKTNDGWIDVDEPSNHWRVRWEARQARRARLGPNTKSPASIPTQTTVLFGVTPTSTDGTTITPFTSLQNKLYVRLTSKQGVSDADAVSVVLNNTYNKAASYGHMRQAGATHAEAEIVIGLSNPDISLAYGINRAKKMSHTDALAEALKVCKND